LYRLPFFWDKAVNLLYTDKNIFGGDQMNEIGLNLARKWRSKQFDQIIGQKLVIRTVKNSLYRNLIFPVYLFSGTKGCGKTTTARLFASALNCQGLDTFRKNPQNVGLPCLTCISCSAMQLGQHPDFIEIDAASHTGVDNVRAIIDAAAFVPVVGTKKIYLIDEAHMLSKAAFNALLKILEEPPHSVLFMLATTDPHKIIDTVRSRCFQLFFHPLSTVELLPHLSFICQQEKIAYDKEALELIASLAEGSARDAINLIERVRLVHPILNKNAVLEVLGCIDNEQLVVLFKAVIEEGPAELLQRIKELHLERYNILIVWKKYVGVLRAAVWVKYGLEANQESLLKEQLLPLVQHCSVTRLLGMLELCYTYEFTLAKTSAPHTVFEMVLLTMQQKQPGELKKLSSQESIEKSERKDTQGTQSSVTNSAWDSFLRDVEKLDDPLILSIFKQGIFSKYQAGKVEVTFSQDLKFFEEWLKTTKDLWQPILERCFQGSCELSAHFTALSAPLAPKITPQFVPAPLKQAVPIRSQSFTSKPNRFVKEQEVVISDKEKWPRASALVRIFPGTITLKSKES
jgi:DNA polymerase III subunit gamma/tau